MILLFSHLVFCHLELGKISLLPFIEEFFHISYNKYLYGIICYI